MYGNFDQLFELTVKLTRGETLVTTSDGGEARAFRGEDGWHAVVVNGRQVVHGDAFDAAQAWMAVEFVTRRMRTVREAETVSEAPEPKSKSTSKTKSRPKRKAKPKRK